MSDPYNDPNELAHIIARMLSEAFGEWVDISKSKEYAEIIKAQYESGINRN